MNTRLTIGEFSKFGQVTVKTLRHYEKLGLLVPHEVDEYNHYRYYVVSQIQQLISIRRLQTLGFSLEEIREVLNTGTNEPSARQIEGKIRQTEQQLLEMSNKLSALRRIAHSLKQINDMECISIQKLPAITVASHRRILKRREDLTPLFQEVINPEIHRIGCRRTLPIYGFTIEHEQEYKTEDIDTEYCLQVDQAQADTPIIKFRQLPEVARAVCLKHTGDYSTIDESFAEVAGYIHSHGLEIDGEYRIQFVEDIHNQRNPDKWITIIQVPVRDKPN